MPRRYRIYSLSAQSILSYAKEEGGAVSIALNRDATRRCVVSDRQEQEERRSFGRRASPWTWETAPGSTPPLSAPTP